MFVTNSLSRRTVLQINLRQLHSVPLGTQAFQLPDAVDDLSCKQRWANIVAMEMLQNAKVHKQRLRKKLELRARML